MPSGCLVNNTGAYPGAGEFIDYLNISKKEFYVLTNDAAKLPQRSLAEFCRAAGISIAPERFINSGMLLKRLL